MKRAAIRGRTRLIAEGFNNSIIKLEIFTFT